LSSTVDINLRFFPNRKSTISLFSNGTIAFFLKVKALYASNPMPRVLDYGAGRGAWVSLEESKTCRAIRDLRIGAVEVVAADVDAAVLENVCSHRQVVIPADGALPFEDETFDIIVSDYVFEHVANPEKTAKELLRILKPGGWICARTAKQIRLCRARPRAASPTGCNRAVLHAFNPTGWTSRISDHLRALFVARGSEILSRPESLRHAFFRRACYHFNNTWMYRAMLILHWLLPKSLAPGLMVFVQK